MIDRAHALFKIDQQISFWAVIAFYWILDPIEYVYSVVSEKALLVENLNFP
jgi:hypothetical protein